MIRKFDKDQLLQTRRLAFGLALLPIIIAVLALFGWNFDVESFKSVFRGLWTMNPVTAICIILLGISFCLFYSYPKLTKVSKLLSVCIFIVACVKMLYFAHLTTFQVDRIIFPEKIHNSYMAPLTTFNFFLLSVGVFLIHAKSRTPLIIAQILAFATGAVSLFAILAYQFHSVDILSHSYYQAMALNTAVAFLFLASALFLIKPDVGIITIFTNNTLGGETARNLLPGVIFIMPIMSLISIIFEGKGYVSQEAGYCLFIVMSICMFSILVFYVCHLLARKDIEYRELTQKYQQSLSKNLADIKFALDTSSIVSFTDKEGKIVYVNDKFCEISKYSREELLGQNHRTVNSQYHSKEFFRTLWGTLLQGAIWRGEMRNKAKDGSFYWLESTIVPFCDDNGRPYQFVEVSNDITQRKHLGESVGALSLRMIQLQEDERSRIARDIHDDLGQSLIAFKMDTQGVFSKLPIQEEHYKKQLTKVVIEINNIINKTRNIAYTLKPSTFQILGVNTSIEALVNDFGTKNGLDIQLEINNLDDMHFKADSINLYRLIQEALTNIVKHAKATKVTIGAEIKNDQLMLTITDNGKGFDLSPKGNFKYAQSLGLNTMRERVRLMQGEFVIDTKPGHGTSIRVVLPVQTKGAGIV